MKSIKIISILICVVTIICAIAITSNAKWWDENPFTDVKSSHWYYDAVRITNENGIFNGTADDKYSPSVKMTRAMLVQALASADGFNKEDYKYNNQFTDVKSNHWFAPAVEWAYTNKITSGKTDTTFAPNENITREQLAAMLYRYAEYKGMTIENKADITEFPDSDKVSTYAVENLKWAYGNGIVNGSKSGDKLYLNPRNPATRAECATMFSKYLYLTPTYEINGNDLSLYTIVYSDAEAAKVDSINDAAQALQKYIRSATGIALPVMSDSSPAGEYEILLGKTTREVKADLGTLTSDMEYICAVEGNTLVLIGTDDSTKLNGNGDRSHHNINGTLNAVYNFLEEKFGYDFYYDGEGIVSDPDPVISLEDGYYHTDIQAFESVSMYINSEGAECYLHDNYYSEWGCNVPHQLVNLINGGWKNGYGTPTVDNICYSDPANIEKALINTRELLESRPQLNLVGLMQTDSDAICRCERCAAIYRADGRAGTIVRLVNYVAENLEEEYPDVKYASISYNWSSKPPKSDLSYHKNVILYHAPITVCPTHAYTDTSCEYNDSFPDNIKTWSEKASKFYVWDYTGSFGDCMAPCPDLDSIHTNVKAFYDSGVRGVFLNGRMGNTSDMYGLRAYLFTQLYRDPLMSEEEYYYHMNGYLKTFYGDGWSYIREYIDKLTDIADQKCSGTHVDIDKLYDFDLVYKAGKELDALWDKAEAAAKTETHLANIQKHRLTWTYLWQSARYEKDYTNGDAASREEYTAVSAKLSEDIVKFNVKWDGKGDEPSGDFTVPPYQW